MSNDRRSGRPADRVFLVAASRLLLRRGVFGPRHTADTSELAPPFGGEPVDVRATFGSTFMPPLVMGQTAAAAVSFPANSQAVIIDLRQNGTGSPDGVAFIASYLFDHVRLVDARQVDWQDRAHFYAVSARIMSRILVDAARAKGSWKRGGRAERA